MIQIKPAEFDFIHATLKDFFPQAKIIFFGSRVTGKAKKYSDLDIAIDNRQPIDLVTLAKIKAVFADSDLPYKIDIVDWWRISPEFQQVIVAQGKICS